MADPVLEESCSMLEDYLERCVHKDAQPPRSPLGQTVWRVTAEIVAGNRDFYESCERLPGDARTTLQQVAAQLPGDGGLNWGRVAGLIAFAGVLLRRPGGHKTGTPRELAEVLSRFLLEEHGDWFHKNGEWDGFCKFYNKHGTGQVQDNSMFSNALMAAAGFGIAGLVFLLTVR